jgi:hypothetical protein
MKATIIFKDSNTGITITKTKYGTKVRYSMFLNTAKLDEITKRGIPVYSELKQFYRDNQIIDSSTPSLGIESQGVMKTARYILFTVLFKDERIGSDELIINTFSKINQYLKSHSYKDDFSSSSTSRYTKFKKKGFYQPEGEFIKVLSCENGVTFYAENIAFQISFSLTISEDIDKISFGDFKEFKSAVMMSTFRLEGKIFESIYKFTYVPSGQYFSMQTDIPFSDYEKVKVQIENFAEKVCEYARKYYPVKSVATTTEKSQREIVQEQIEATNTALQYSSSMSQEQIADLKEYIESLELILKYI